MPVDPLEELPMPSEHQLAQLAGMSLQDYLWQKALADIEALKKAHNILAADALRKSMFKSWGALFVVFMGALAAPVATAVWDWLKGFHR